jgi:hypothetical protein
MPAYRAAISIPDIIVQALLRINNPVAPQVYILTRGAFYFFV